MLEGSDMLKLGLYPRTLLAAVCAVAVYLSTGVTVAMQVTSAGPQTIQKAQGEKVTLECMYTPAPSDVGELDIEWSVVSPDMTQKDNLIMSYTGGKKWTHGDPTLTTGLEFRAGDPSHGDASVSIAALKVSHTGTYQCKVKKAPGVDMRKVTVVVMERPSVPKCWMEGSDSVGGAVSLHCKASQGSTPLKYLWARESGGTVPPSATQDPLTGELRIGNLSESFSGSYRCEVSNAVGTERCRFVLRAQKPPSRAGVVVGTVIGALLLVIILALLLFLLICALKRRKNKEAANDIREDSPPPVSRPHSRVSSFRPGVIYSSVRTGGAWPDSEFSSVLSSSNKPPQPASSLSTGLKYDTSYGHPV
ncbi:coxsackievirus and adenovirus receptor homolog [Megalops cyprinoides]|uniref:coxsackievirus and adenovirus receptor homolog n=1 Tax=Megalops cyprinoides TaxID=118141 RepID=UPI0018643CED|nr:coxsackievirus and adenovirus receptor homolog [Megalops cyprinoides]XP_036385378.1 coxsackievirus and adenovirus receptor homolog [Megalops cyprinoides]